MLFVDPPLQLKPDVWILRGFARSLALASHLDSLLAQAPLRHLTVSALAGKKPAQMSVGMSNCGALGWTSDATGYRYVAVDPLTRHPWPAIPLEWRDVASQAAQSVGWSAFDPDACLINHYIAGASMGLHQDRDEADQSQPIVSVSKGASCKFMIGGLKRSDPVRSTQLHDGDVVVWGGQARRMFHGVRQMGAERWNLTFRKAG